MKKTVALILALILSLAAVALPGCGAKKYAVDYDGKKSAFKGAEDSYEEGEKVTLCFNLVATDTDYHFYLDGTELQRDYSDEDGFILTFTMPARDVKLTYTQKNSMVYVPDVEPGTMIVDYFDAVVGTNGNDRYTEYVLYQTDDPSVARLELYVRNPGDLETCVRYAVPYDAVERCFDAIDEEDFASWKDRDDLTAIDGARLVCQYLNTDGTYTRVSTDDMPPDGKASLSRIGAIISEYVRDEYLTEE